MPTANDVMKAMIVAPTVQAMNRKFSSSAIGVFEIRTKNRLGNAT